MANGGYYTQDEAMKKLALGKEDLDNLVREGKLREFRVDGQPKYKTSEIDALAAEINPAGGSDASSTDFGSESAIELTPADASDSGTDVVSLEETGDQLAPISPSKEDTVITPAGVSVFDEDELTGMDADPMAKTQIAQSVTDELSIEGGSGSGLLDMTRESDDTSLGAELLDEIYSGDETQPDKAIPGGEPAAAVQPEAFDQPEEVITPAPARMMVQVVDAGAGLFTGLIVAAAILLGFSGMVAAFLVPNIVPGFIGWLSTQIYIWIVIAIVVTGAGLGLGFFLGKRAAA